MKKLSRLVICALVIPLGFASSTMVVSAADAKKPAMAKAADPKAAKADAAIKTADAARKKAASVGGEWRDTGKFIKKAKAAAKKGDFAKALKLAKKAEAEGHMGYEQAVAQKELHLPSYLKY